MAACGHDACRASPGTHTDQDQLTAPTIERDVEHDRLAAPAVEHEVEHDRVDDGVPAAGRSGPPDLDEGDLQRRKRLPDLHGGRAGRLRGGEAR